MTSRHLRLGLIAIPLLLAGCASTAAAPRTTPSTSVTTGPAAASATATKAAAPSPLALMICGPDIRGKVAQALALTSPVSVRSAYANHRYTCTYQLPMGPLVLSVQESPNRTTAGAYFVALRRQLSPTEPLIGLGERAYGTATGHAVVVKDSLTLHVDATGLPTVFGAQRQKRTDLAYEIASDVLGCWTGND